MAVMLSTPPPSATSTPSLMIRCAAMAIACKPGRAEAIDRRPGHGHRQAGADRGDAGHVRALRAFGIGAAQENVFDLGRIELRHLLEHVRDAMRGQIVGPGQIERTAKTLGQRRARAGNHDGFSHRSNLPETEGWQTLGLSALCRLRKVTCSLASSGGLPTAEKNRAKTRLAAYRPFGRMYTVRRALRRDCPQRVSIFSALSGERIRRQRAAFLARRADHDWRQAPRHSRSLGPGQSRYGRLRRSSSFTRRRLAC